MLHFYSTIRRYKSLTITKKTINLFAVIFVFVSSIFFFASTVEAGAISKAPNNLSLVGYWSFNEGAATIAIASSTVYKYGATAAAGAAGTVSWTNIDNAKAEDGSFATATMGPGHTTDEMWITNFDFSAIPDSAIIKGVAVKINAKTTGVDPWDSGTVSLIVGGATAGTPKASPSLTGTLAKYSLGGATDKWGASISTASVKASNFGVSYQPSGTADFDTGSVDSIEMSVHYTIAGDATSTTATDFSGNGNAGTLTNGPTWTAGKLGKALSFDGSNDYVNVADSTSLDITGDITLSAWINPTSVPQTGIIIGKNTGAGVNYQMAIINDNTLQFLYGDSSHYATWTPSAGVWQHIILTYSGSQKNFYINGSLLTSTTTTPSVTANNTALTIGQAVSTAYFNGKIDEVRVYTRALSAAEVTKLYQSGLAKLNQATPDGLMGYWKFNEYSGSTAADSSGLGNTGTLSNSPTWVDGKFGQALQFNGTNQRVSVGSVFGLNGDVPHTFSAWVKPLGTTGSYQFFVSVGACSGGCVNTHAAFWLTDTLQDIGFGAPNGSNIISAGMPTEIGKWYHVVGTYSGSVGILKIYINGKLKNTRQAPSALEIGGTGTYIGQTIGTNNGGWTNAVIDDVRIYNRELTGAQVADIYRQTNINHSENNIFTSGLVGLWSFNGVDVAMSSSTAYDRSGQGNNGTLTNGPVPTIGKVGQAMSFDGSDDYVSLPNNILSTQGTVSMWFKAGTVGGTDDYLWAYDNNDNPEIRIIYTTDGNVRFWGYDNGSYQWQLDALPSVTVIPGDWYHVVGIWGSNDARLYLNGTLVESDISVALVGTGSIENRLGYYSGAANSYFNGSIDEVRMYNRALSAADVLKLYMAGR